jgi:hypothetical protein
MLQVLMYGPILQRPKAQNVKLYVYNMVNISSTPYHITTVYAVGRYCCQILLQEHGIRVNSVEVWKSKTILWQVYLGRDILLVPTSVPRGLPARVEQCSCKVSHVLILGRQQPN